MSKIYYCLLVIALALKGFGQHPCSTSKIKSNSQKLKSVSASITASPEQNYDVKFYHLNLNAERNSLFISGNVRCLAKIVSTSLDTFACVLHQNHTVDSVYVNGSKQDFVRQDSLVKISTGATLLQNQLVDVTVYYKGTCPSGGGAAIGNGYNIDTSPSWGNEVAWTLSESFVAYEWFPCKQDLKDKIDSSWVFITTDSSNLAGSNGLLKNIVMTGNKKRFEWKSTYPIDYYLISMSIAKYKEYNLYAKPLGLPNDSILIQNYIYDNAINNPNWISGQKVELDEIVPTIELFSNLFGMYPFYKEKYGHCMAPLGGGMEHQTMTTLGFFNFDLDAHELGHQWWGDYVTCKSWGDIWINEGWASYSEYIANQYLISKAVADNNMLQVHTNVMSQSGGSVYFTNADTLNTARIFSSRLTYDKGGAIVHSIRFELNNDTLFFNICKGFLATYQYSVASVIDFKNYLNANSGKNFDQFFNQWYYGEGYPTFNVKWNQVGNTLYLKSTQTTSSFSVPLFITPLEYKIYRSSLPDTIIRVMHTQSTEVYTLPISGTITSVEVDPNNWILNKTIGPVKDVTLVSVEEQENNASVFVGPNPTSDRVYVNMYNNTKKATAELIDVTGKIIKHVSFYNKTELDVSTLPNGIYTITIKNITGQLLYSKKVIKT